MVTDYLHLVPWCFCTFINTLPIKTWFSNLLLVAQLVLWFGEDLSLNFLGSGSMYRSHFAL